MDYRISGNFLDQKGIIDKNSTRRIGLGANYNQRLADDRLSLRFNVRRGTREDDKFVPLGVLSNAANFSPTQSVFDPNSPTGFYNWPGGLTSPDNPLEILDLAQERATTYRSVGNVQGEYSLPWINGLRANLNLGYDITRAKREARVAPRFRSRRTSPPGSAPPGPLTK